MNIVKIRGLEVAGRIGVHEEEKKNEQPFVFDIDFETDFYEGAKKDDVNKVVNYSNVCKVVAEIVRNNKFSLIERLAYECSFSIMERYPVKRVSVTVWKPQAPIKYKFDSVGVTSSMSRERVYLSLGSNLGDRRAHLDAAIWEIENTRGIVVKKVSKYYETEAYGGVTDKPFVNCALEIETCLTPAHLLSEIHRIESSEGRTRDVRWGDRTLDIDIIFYGKESIREDDLIVPHPDYKNRAFVLKPILEIAPGLACPESGEKLKDIYEKLKRK